MCLVCLLCTGCCASSQRTGLSQNEFPKPLVAPLTRPNLCALQDQDPEPLLRDTLPQLADTGRHVTQERGAAQTCNSEAPGHAVTMNSRQQPTHLGTSSTVGACSLGCRTSSERTTKMEAPTRCHPGQNLLDPMSAASLPNNPTSTLEWPTVKETSCADVTDTQRRTASVLELSRVEKTHAQSEHVGQQELQLSTVGAQLCDRAHHDERSTTRLLKQLSYTASLSTTPVKLSISNTSL